MKFEIYQTELITDKYVYRNLTIDKLIYFF
jgi:hypothetical protein